MIKITVELLPFGFEKKKKLLGSMVIYNDATGSHDIGNYKFHISKWEPKEKEIWKTGEVKGFDRIKRGCWDLLYLCLKSVLEGRSEK